MGVDKELVDAIKFLAMEKRIKQLKDEKERLEAELEKEKYGGLTKEETSRKLKEYFNREWCL